ncbi:hypothetical protein DKP78_25240, partial [Enterococcus faecium]
SPQACAGKATAKQDTMKFIALVLVGLSCFHKGAGEVHSAKYFYTASSGIPRDLDFPEFITLLLIDGQPASYYDSRTKR